MSAIACVSAAEPDRQQNILSWTGVNLSVTRLAMYDPVVVLESAPITTPPLNVVAMIEVCIRWLRKRYVVLAHELFHHTLTPRSTSPALSPCESMT